MKPKSSPSLFRMWEWASRPWQMRWAMLLVMTSLLSFTAQAQGQEEEEGGSGRDCSQTSIGVTPLTDLAGNLYQGEPGGLYPGGTNEIPADHHELGLRRASEIVPRGPTGLPQPDGDIGFLSVGVSNTFREFDTFTRVVQDEAALEASVVFVNGAQGGAALSQWRDPESRAWETLDEVVTAAGVSAAQIQVVWIKMVARIDAANPAEPFPQDARTYQDDLSAVLPMLQARFPNLAVAYLSSRIYGGYNPTSSPSPEPWAYQQGFGVKWTIQDQIEGDPSLSADPGNAVVPWLAWGPYLWADGEQPRSDGLVWTCRDMRGDGVHPSRLGQEKVAGLLVDFLRDEPTAAWMWSDRLMDSPPSTTVGSTSPSTTPPSSPTPSSSPPSTSEVESPSASTTSPNQPPDRESSLIVWAILVLAVAGTALGTRRALKHADPDAPK